MHVIGNTAWVGVQQKVAYVGEVWENFTLPGERSRWLRRVVVVSLLRTWVAECLCRLGRRVRRGGRRRTNGDARLRKPMKNDWLLSDRETR